MSPYTAIVLSKNPVTLKLQGVEVLGRTQEIRTLAELLDARLGAIKDVRTDYCFYLDDDDELPEDYLSVLDECASQGAAVAYTDELIDAGRGYIRSNPAPYSREAHCTRPFLIHHLALMRTKDAQGIAKKLPRGEFAVEPLLYSELAKQSASYVPRAGYYWKKGGGLNTISGPATFAAVQWCRAGGLR